MTSFILAVTSVLLPISGAASQLLDIPGQVVSPSGTPIGNVSVSVQAVAAPLHRVTRTDARGRFVLIGIPAGEYRISIEAAKYEAQNITMQLTSATAPLRIVLRQTLTGLHVIGSVASHGTLPFNAAPVAQRVFPREAYRDQGQPDVTSVLEQTPGALVTWRQNANFAVPVVPSYALVRGGLPYETPTLLDGEPVSLPSTGTFDLSLVPTYVLQEVEIVKGPGDPAGSGGGVDGSINLRTADPTLALRGMLELEADSRGGQFSDLAYDGTLPGGKFAIATMASIDGSPGPLAGFSLPNSPGSDALRKALLLKVRATPNDSLTVTATMLAVNLDRALAGTYGSLLDDNFVTFAPELGARQDERLRFEQVLGQYQRGHDDIDVHLYSLDLSDNGYAATSSLADALDRERGGGISWSHQISTNVYGISFDEAAMNAYDDDLSSLVAFGQSLLNGSQRSTADVRATATLHTTERSQFDIAAEAIDDSDRFAPTGTGFETRSWTPFDTRIAYSQTLEPSLALRAAIGTSSVTPSLDMLSGGLVPQLSVGIPNQSIRFSSNVAQAEEAQGADVGLEWRLHGQTTTLSFDLYTTQTQHAFLLSTTQPLPSLQEAVWSNGPSMYDEGAEISLVQFKPVGLGFIVQAALPRTYVAGPLPANVMGIPYAQGYGEISYKWPRGSRLSLGMLYAGANNSYGRPGFAALNSNLELSVGAKSKFQISVQNLLNAFDNRLPVTFGGVPVPFANITTAAVLPNVIGPRTVRVMFRQSFGGGAIYEH